MFLKLFFGSQTGRFLHMSSIYLLICICSMRKCVTCTHTTLSGKIAVVLEFDDFISPACPIRLETSSKHFQTLSMRPNVWLQHS